jgi:hypothetical protein
MFIFVGNSVNMKTRIISKPFVQSIGLQNQSIYIKAKRADFVPFVGVCVGVLLGDGSGGVFFLVSSRSVSYW